MDGTEILSAGTVGGIVGAVGTWLAKYLLESRARQEQATLNNRLAILEQRLEVVSHAARAQFDREYDAYQKIWVALCELDDILRDLPYGPFGKPAGDLIGDFRIKLDEFLRVSRLHMPFYSQEVFAAIIPISKFAAEAYTQLKIGMPDEMFLRWRGENAPHLENAQRTLHERIRGRVEMLQAIQSPVK